MKATVKKESVVDIESGYYNSYGLLIFVDEKKVIRVNDKFISRTDDLHEHEVKDIIDGYYQPCTPSEFWAAYQTTMSTFMLEYHEHVSKGKANDFIAQQSDRAGEFPEKYVV